ncbi:MAG: hypothetical protein Q8K98_10475 [Bacteroidota bacterium]|nr:hypothetical protein [Bacteroidota bacterium]
MKIRINLVTVVLLTIISCSEKTDYQKGLDAKFKNNWQTSLTHFYAIPPNSPDYDSAQAQIKHINNAIIISFKEPFEKGDYLSIVQFIDNNPVFLKDPMFDTIRISVNTIFLRESKQLAQSMATCYTFVLRGQYDNASEVLHKYPTPLINTNNQAAKLFRIIQGVQAQRLFESKRASFWKNYNIALNEIKKSQIFNEANNWTASNYSYGTYWRGTIKQLSTDKGGSKVDISIESTQSGFTVEYRTSMSFFEDKSMIRSGTAVYNQLSDVAVGDEVFFVFSFIPDKERSIREGSLTESGSMYKPEFIVDFTEILSMKELKH